MSTANESSFDLPTKLFEPGSEPILQDHINYYSHLNLFGEKWDRYFEKELDYIKSSPFGVLYRLAKENEFIWSGTLVHFLLSKQLVTKRKYELWSVFGGQPMRFSLEEFGYITGLSCDPYPTDNGEDDEEVTSRWTRMLKSKNYPSLQDLEEMAEACSEWSFEDRIRLAYLLILAGILIARRRTCHLPRKYIELVRNLDRFEAYPWGRAAFEILIESVHEVRNDLGNPSYVINGFVQVLQIWGYEAVPLIAKKAKAHAHGVSYESVMLKWKGSRARIDFYGLDENSSKVEVHTFIGNVDTSTLVESKWSDEIEDPQVSNLIDSILSSKKFERSIWVGHGLKEGIPFRVKKRKISKVQDGGEVAETEEFVSRLYFDSCIKELHKTISNGFSCLSTKIEIVDTKINVLEEQMKAMQQCAPNVGRKQALSTDSAATVVRKCSKTFSNEIRDAFVDNIDTDNVNDKAGYCADMHTRGNNCGDDKVYSVHSVAAIPLVEKDVSVQVSTTPLAENKADSVQCVSATQSLENNFKTRKLQMVNAKFKAFTETLRAELEQAKKENGMGTSQKHVSIPHLKKTSVKSLSYYDPFGPIDKAKIDALNEWNKLESNELDLGFYKVTKQFWDFLITETKFLHTGHIDACLTFLRRRSLKTPSPFQSERIGFLDTYFSFLICRGYKDFLNNTEDYVWGAQLIDYYNGVYPGNIHTNKKFLIDVDDLYTVINLDNDHWVALAISLARRQINIYDSLISHTREAQMQEKVAPYARMIPHLIKRLSGNKRLKDTAYNVRRVKGIPQNYQVGDCGVYAIKYIECLALGVDMKLGLSDTNIGHIRRKLASELFDESRCNL